MVLMRVIFVIWVPVECSTNFGLISVSRMNKMETMSSRNHLHGGEENGNSYTIEFELGFRM